MLARIRKTMEEKDQGFTLIELLVVVVIIGILAAIAIPTFLNQREKAWQRASMSDLRNASVKMEEAFSDLGTYVNIVGITDDAATANIDESTFAAKASDDVTLSVPAAFLSSTGYCIQAVHAKLKAPNNTYHLKSDTGKPATGACA